MCQMVEANVGIGVMPESAAIRHAQSTSIHIIQLLDEWAEREMKICVRRFDVLPTFARRLVDYIIDYEDKRDGSKKPSKCRPQNHAAPPLLRRFCRPPLEIDKLVAPAICVHRTGTAD